jgi:hypothetical protein
MRGAGGFQLDSAFERAIIEPIQDLFVFLRRHHLLGGDVYAAPHRNQEEGVQRVRSDFLSQFQDGRELVRIMPGNRHVYLE